MGGNYYQTLNETEREQRDHREKMDIVYGCIAKGIRRPVKTKIYAFKDKQVNKSSIINSGRGDESTFIDTHDFFNQVNRT
jgi:hypothetical protein